MIGGIGGFAGLFDASALKAYDRWKRLLLRDGLWQLRDPRAAKRIRMNKEQAEGFYAVHRERPFFNDLVAFMTSGPVVVQVLEGEDAVKRNRDIMGATNPENAEPGTIRKELAESIEANSVHGSDSDENAAIEIAFFFKPEEIVG